VNGFIFHATAYLSSPQFSGISTTVDSIVPLNITSRLLLSDASVHTALMVWRCSPTVLLQSKNSQCDPSRFLTDVDSSSGPDMMYYLKTWSFTAILLLSEPEFTLVLNFMSSSSVFFFGPKAGKRYNEG
jgi:hypothetical protein